MLALLVLVAVVASVGTVAAQSPGPAPGAPSTPPTVPAAPPADAGAPVVDLPGSAPFLAPRWYPAAPGEVVAIPARVGAATVEDVVPQPTPYGLPVKNLIAAWNGGALVERDGEPWLALHGGGHGDYGGNEVVVFGPLTAELPSWVLLSPPTPGPLIDTSAPYNLDGTPNVSHTRDTMCALDGVLYRAMQAGIFTATTSWDTFDSFDVATARWRPAGTHPDVPAGGGVRGSCVADTRDGVVWVLRDGINSRLRRFSPATNAWTLFDATYTVDIETTAAYSEERHELFLFESRTAPRHALFDLSDPDADPDTQGFAGDPPPDKCGLVWDAGRGVYAALGTDDRNLVRELDPVAKRWVPRVFTGPTEPVPADAVGIFGRFRYVRALRGYVYVGATDGAVYFYRSE